MVAASTSSCPTCNSLAPNRNCQWCNGRNGVMIPVPVVPATSSPAANTVCVGFSQDKYFFDQLISSEAVASNFTFMNGSWRAISCELMNHRGYQCPSCWIAMQFIYAQKPAWLKKTKDLHVNLVKPAALAFNHPALKIDTSFQATAADQSFEEPASSCSTPSASAMEIFRSSQEECSPKCKVSKNSDFKRRVSESVKKQDLRVIKKSRQRLPASAVNVLQKWFMEHLRRPYPTDADKVELSKHANLSVAQVINWFTNTRKRVWLPRKVEGDAGAFRSEAELAFPRRSPSLNYPYHFSK